MTATLTDREHEVIVALWEHGGSHKEAAHALGITVGQLRERLRCAYAALGVHTYVDACRKLGYGPR